MRLKTDDILNLCEALEELEEKTKGDLLRGVDWNFQHFKDYAKQTRNRGSFYLPFNPQTPTAGSNGQYLFFRTVASPDSGKRYHASNWYQTIKLDDFEQYLKNNVDEAVEAVRKLTQGNISVNCTCPGFKYNGYHYISSKMNASIFNQSISPVIRNPEERGTVCKHIVNVLQELPKFYNQIASDLEKQGYKVKKVQISTTEPKKPTKPSQPSSPQQATKTPEPKKGLLKRAADKARRLIGMDKTKKMPKSPEYQGKDVDKFEKDTRTDELPPTPFK